MWSEGTGHWHFMGALGIPVAWCRQLFRHQAVLEGRGRYPTHAASFSLPLHSGAGCVRWVRTPCTWHKPPCLHQNSFLCSLNPLTYLQMLVKRTSGQLVMHVLFPAPPAWEHRVGAQ